MNLEAYMNQQEYKPRSYTLLRDRWLRGKLLAKGGDAVFALKGHDYGLASDDSRITGVEHVSVTLKSDGSYPSFTVPAADLKEIA
jgi:hypothetical protein